MFLKALRVLFGFLGAPLGTSWSLWGEIGMVWGDFWGILILITFWNGFGSQKDAQRDALWEPKWSRNRSKIEVQILERKHHILEQAWIDLSSISEPSWGRKTLIFLFYFLCFANINFDDECLKGYRVKTKTDTFFVFKNNANNIQNMYIYIYIYCVPALN